MFCFVVSGCCMGAIFFVLEEEGYFFRKGLKMRLKAGNWKGDFVEVVQKIIPTLVPNIGAGSDASPPGVLPVNGSEALGLLGRFEKKSGLNRFFVGILVVLLFGNQLGM